MIAELNLLQPYWLLVLPFPWLWLYWRLRHPVSWPKLQPVLTMRYPLLAALEKKQTIKNKNGLKKRLVQRDKTMAIALSFMILALAQPVRYGAAIESETSSEPVDLILVIDTALSMSLKDYEIQAQAVSRLAMSQLLLKDFINNYSGKRIALVTLGNPPALWLPLTTDKTVVQDAVSRMTTFLGGRLSDMGATLELISHNFTDAQEKVVVLISDGGVQVGSVSPNEIAKKLSSNGFTLYSIAVGANNPNLISPDNSSLIFQPVNIAVLQELVNNGDGKLFHAINTQVFSDALQTIEKKHRKPRPQKATLKLTEAWYPLPLAIAMLLLLYAGLVQQESYKQVSK